MRTNRTRPNFLRHAKIAQTTALLASIALMNSACRREMILVEDLEIHHKGKFQVETDFPYYSVTYRYGGMRATQTETMRNKKGWEKEFDVNTGDTLFFEVNTIKSNLPGTHLQANIYMDGKLISSKNETTACEDGSCPVLDAPSLQLETIVW